jgi:hypothetical protein
VKLETFIPVAVFLAVSIPVVWLLNALDFGGEYRVWVAIGVGALATGYAQSRLAAKHQQNPEQQA